MKFIIYNKKGLVLFQNDPKINSFNAMINNIINESNLSEFNNIHSTTANKKTFKYLINKKLTFALAYDSIISFNSNKINSFLNDIAELFIVLIGEDSHIDKTEESYVKFENMFNLRFAELEDFKEVENSEEEEIKRSDTDLGLDKKKVSPAGAVTKNGKKVVKSTKKARRWDGIDGDIDDSTLDFSTSNAGDESSYNPQLVGDTANYGAKENNLFLISEMNDILDAKRVEESSDPQESTSIFSGFVKKFIGGKTITDQDVDKISQNLVNHLIGKNVAPEIAKNLINKLGKQLVGSKTPSFTTIENFFRQNLIEELTKILTPNVSTDLLHDIKQKINSPKSNGRPYVISMVGVNGVGKSTNLAKLAYWFLQNDFKVLICACDTFRSGAVEQLRVHVKNLQKAVSNPDNIHLFEKGYGGGDHVVQTAKSAIEFAKEQKFQIVLIDTAGRTHSNTKLMEPLKKFGEAANPDKIIMVGEALVGTDSVEQARNFNNAFGKNRCLNFFIISKVDTVGPLVGTMINMVVATNVPILFIGVGQTYTDIKRLSIPVIVDLLIS